MGTCTGSVKRANVNNILGTGNAAVYGRRMEFQPALTRGQLVRRYKRFLADVTLDDGETVTAHCPNPGSMMGLSTPGTPVWLSRSSDPKRKLPWGLELVDAGSSLVGVHTGRANAIVEEALKNWILPGLTGYARRRREVRYGEGSRVDFLMESDIGPDCYLEVKSVTLKRDDAVPGAAEFPDAVTKRGAKQLDDLASMVRQGHRAVLLFLVQRSDCQRVAVARDIDPAYAAAFDKAVAEGVEVVACTCSVTPTGIEPTGPLPVEMA